MAGASARAQIAEKLPSKAAPNDASSGCCGGFRAIGSSLKGICEPVPIEQEAGHVRLAKMHEERDRELAAAKLRAVEAKLHQEIALKEWEDQLVQLHEKRTAMTSEELDKDVLDHFAAAEWLRTVSGSSLGGRDGTELANPEGEEADPQAQLADEAAAETVARAAAEPAGPQTPFEHWLADHMGLDWMEREDGDTEAHHMSRGAGCRWRCFGTLPPEAMLSVADSLSEVLARSAEEDSKRVDEVLGRAGKVKTAGFSEKFDEILARYASEGDEDQTEAEEGVSPEEAAVAQEQAQAEAEALRSRCARFRAVGTRVASLAPTLEGDTASARLVAALAVLDLVEDPRLSPSAVDGRLGSVGTGVDGELSGLPDFSGFRAPLGALSTADACWALCSEKRHLVVERMLPSAAAEGRWSWPEVRRCGVGWWLCGASASCSSASCDDRDASARQLEQMDAIVSKLAQSAVAQLRHYEKTGKFLGQKSSTMLERCDSSNSKALQRLADKAVFWYVLLGTKLTKLKALVKTGVLRAEPALAALLNHEKSEDPLFLRKNAFRLLQLHRFQLAVALFLLCDCWEEAASVAAKHLQDMQLVLILARRRPDISAPMLRNMLAELPPPASGSAMGEDAWLRLLLAWHVGDAAEAARAVSSVAAAAASVATVPCVDVDSELFDGVFRLSSARSCAGLADVATTLFGPGVAALVQKGELEPCF